MLNQIMLVGLAALSLTACTKDTVEETAAPCGVEISSTAPAAGNSNFYYRGDIRVTLTDADSTAEISVDGVTGTSALAEDNKSLSFTPDAPLDPSTAYTFTVDYCGGSAPVDFTTSSLGTAIDDPSSLTGSVFALDLQADDVEIVIPAGVGSVLESYLEIALLLEVESADASTLQIFAALGSDSDGEVQEFCDPTLPFPDADFTGAPYFQLGPQTTTISAAGLDVEIRDLFISGTFAADGSYWGGGVLQGSVDTRPLVPLLEDCDFNESTPETDDDCEDGAICELVEGFGVACEDCGDGTEFCLEIKAIGLGGDSVSTDLDVVALGDCHEQCEDTWNYSEDGSWDGTWSNAECSIPFPDPE